MKISASQYLFFQDVRRSGEQDLVQAAPARHEAVVLTAAARNSVDCKHMARSAGRARHLGYLKRRNKVTICSGFTFQLTRVEVQYGSYCFFLTYYATITAYAIAIKSGSADIHVDKRLLQDPSPLSRILTWMFPLSDP